MMFNHVGIRVRNIALSCAFYDAALKPMRIVRSSTYEGGAGYGRDGVVGFWISETRLPGAAHLAFAASSTAEVEAFYTSGLEAGGSDNGAPGPRPDYGPDYFAAFLIDPDGHNVEAVYMKNARV